MEHTGGVGGSPPTSSLDRALLPTAMTVAAVPPVLSAVGFTGTGIAASSLAAKMMSLSAIANGGGVPAGGLVAILQSAGKCPGRRTRGSAGHSPLSVSFPPFWRLQGRWRRERRIAGWFVYLGLPLPLGLAISCRRGCYLDGLLPSVWVWKSNSPKHTSYRLWETAGVLWRPRSSRYLWHSWLLSYSLTP